MKKYISLLCLLLCFVLPLNVAAIGDYTITQEGNKLIVDSEISTKGNDLDVMEGKLFKMEELVTVISGLAALTMVVIFIRHCIKLATLGTEHWAVKRQAIVGLLWSGLSAALLGAGTIIIAISYNVFK